jgi:sugar phosphate isomerase/epimerase
MLTIDNRTAHDLAWPDLVWSHFSRPRFGQFDERVAAASAAGFQAIGLYAYEYQRLRDEEHRSLAAIAELLDRHNLLLGEVETVKGWWATGGPALQTAHEVEALAYELADGVGVRYLQAIGSFEGTFDEAVAGFAALCDRAAEHDLKVGIEWLPYTNIANADDARRIVEAADRPNAGYCADIWHHKRGANDVDMLRALPAERIFAVQMNDGPLTPTIADYKEDCLASRVPPGEGEFDAVGFVKLLIEMGVTAPISLEVASTELWVAPIDEVAQRTADAMRAVLAAAR